MTVFEVLIEVIAVIAVNRSILMLSDIFLPKQPAGYPSFYQFTLYILKMVDQLSQRLDIMNHTIIAIC